MFVIRNGIMYADWGEDADFTISIVESNGTTRKLKINDKFVLTVSATPTGADLMSVTKTITASEVGHVETTMHLSNTDWAGIGHGRFTCKIIFYPEGDTTKQHTIFPPMETGHSCIVEDRNTQNFWVRP